jgi:hypothetical protein
MSKQVRISFHHDGRVATLFVPSIVPGLSLITQSANRKQELEDFLNDVWNAFGAVTQVAYHKSYVHAIITFSNHKAAVFAFDGLRDPIQFQVALQSAIGGNVQRNDWAKMLFVESHDGHVITPTWIEDS